MTYEITGENVSDFPSVLRRARLYGRYSQAEAAKAIGVTPQTIGAWEKDKATIQKSKRQAAAAFITSTEVLEAEKRQGADTCDDPRRATLGRLAMGPAFSSAEADLALVLEVHHDYGDIMKVARRRINHGPEMSLGDLRILTQAILFDAQQPAE